MHQLSKIQRWEQESAPRPLQTTFQAHLVLVHGLLGFRRDHPLSSRPLDGSDVPLLPLDGRLDATPQSTVGGDDVSDSPAPSPTHFSTFGASGENALHKGPESPWRARADEVLQPALRDCPPRPVRPLAATCPLLFSTALSVAIIRI